MPEERTILMKLLYYDDVTPADYEPPFFRVCSDKEAHNPWTKDPLKMEVGNVNSKHFVLALKVKSVLDPCEDENDDIQDDVSLGDDSAQRDDDTESDSEVSQSADGQYIVAAVDKPQAHEDTTMADEDNTQDSVEDGQQLGRIKDWISSYHLDNLELTDVFSNFPDISVVLTEEIMEKLVKEGVVSRIGASNFAINKNKKSDYEFDEVKEEEDRCLVLSGDKAQPIAGIDYLYMKALYHVLPMVYISAVKLQNKLGEEANLATARKLIDKMTQEGFLEPQSNRRLGKRVIHSDRNDQKLNEIKILLDMDSMDIDVCAPVGKPLQVLQSPGSNRRDTSTYGVLHSIGSDLTRMRGRSDTYQNGSIRTDQTISKTQAHGNTPTSRAEPIASRESFAQRGNNRDEVEPVICSRSTQDKRSRKASMVKDPILQYYMKRQKPQIP
jgi:hypothetical protein